MNLEDERYGRFKSLDWFGQKHTILIAGAGGIGSWCALLLSRLGHELVLLDFDTIERVNLAGQFFGDNQIGQLKVNAVRDNCKTFSGNNITIHSLNTRYEKGMDLPNIVFSGFDNIEGRRDLFEDWKKNEDRILFIDGRLAAESGIILCVTKEREEAYEKTLFSGEAEAIPCTAKITTHCATMLASIMVSYLNNHLSNITTGEDFRELPFYTNFFLPGMILTTDNEFDLVTEEKEREEV